MTRLLFSFDGRINRAKYWLATLIYSIAGMVLLIASVNALASGLSHSSDPASWASVFPIAFYAIGFPLLAVGLWTYAATTIKRLRDRNKSGWWIVPFAVLPVFLPRVAEWLDDSNAAFCIGLVAFALIIWSFVETFCLRGTRGPNRFGPDPLAEADTGLHTASQSPA